MDQVSIDLAKRVMRLRECWPPSPRDNVGGLSEVFRHPMFLHGTEAERNRIMWESARSRYDDEVAFPFDNYFGQPIQHWVNGDVLDLGCFTGGRAVAWHERYQPRSMSGVDTSPAFIEAGRRFAEASGVPIDFRVGFAEQLPWPDGSFDTILSFDVLEHVRSVEKTLDACWRVLRSSGRLIVVFPSYFQPVEHHLSLVTKVPGLQYFFTGRTLISAYNEVLAERTADVRWYDRGVMEDWERGNTINGTTNRRFRRLISSHAWEIDFQSFLSIGSVGRRALAGKGRWLGRISGPFTRIPGLQEVALHRLAYVLRRS